MADKLSPEVVAFWPHTTETVCSQPSRLAVDMLMVRLLVTEYKAFAYYKARQHHTEGRET